MTRNRWPNHAASNPARASRLHSLRPVGRVAELGSLGGPKVSRPSPGGTLYSASHFSPSRRANEESSGLLSLPLRRVRPNRSNANVAEMIRDVLDNVPPSGIRLLEFFRSLPARSSG
jgi:hypothetical protein